MGEQAHGEALPRVCGITFAKQFPSSAEPLRGLFVLRQVLATADVVDWRVIAPVPVAPRGFERLLKRPAVALHETVEGLSVAHPGYRVLPRRLDYGRAGASMAAAAGRAFDQALDQGAQFVHAHALYPSGAAARMLAKPNGVPYIVTVHGSDLYTMLSRPEWTALVRDVVADAAVVVCVSNRLADDVAANLSVDRSVILVIPDAYDDHTYRFSRRTMRATEDPVRIVCVGRLEPPKGPDILVEAMALLRDAATPVRLALVGGGSLDRQLRSRVERLGLGDRVDFTGPLPPDRIAHVLADADLYVQPSRREGFGVALVEAMATGLPAVATASGGPADIVGPGDGMLVQPGDAAALAEGIAEVVGRLGDFDSAAIAERIASRFSPAIVGERLVHLYYDVLSGQKPSGDSQTTG